MERADEKKAEGFEPGDCRRFTRLDAVSDLLDDFAVGWLLGSLPRMDEQSYRRLTSIDGLPPTLLEKPTYCPFEPRCTHAIERCRRENPTLVKRADDDHFVACWLDPTTWKEYE